MASHAKAAAPRPATGMLDEQRSRMVWRTLQGIYGLEWQRAYGAYDQAGAVSVNSWRRGLWQMTDDQLRTGLAACAHAEDPAPPTLPAFRARCLGVPSFAEVQADETRKATPFIEAVYTLANSVQYRQMSSDRSARALLNAYEVVRARAMKGDRLGAARPNEVRESSEAQKATPKNPAHAATNALECRRLLGMRGNGAAIPGVPSELALPATNGGAGDTQLSSKPGAVPGKEANHERDDERSADERSERNRGCRETGADDGQGVRAISG